MADYNPTAPVKDTDILKAEALTTLGDRQNGLHEFALAMQQSLEKTRRAGQPVEGNILDGKDPIAAIKAFVAELLAKRQPGNDDNHDAELPEGCVKGTIVNVVGNDTYVVAPDGQGRTITVHHSKGVKLERGAVVTVKLLHKTDGHGHRVAELAN